MDMEEDDEEENLDTLKKLTREQKAAIMLLGDAEGDDDAIKKDVLEELIELGLVYDDSADGQYDFTDLGESIYDELKSKK